MFGFNKKKKNDPTGEREYFVDNKGIIHCKIDGKLQKSHKPSRKERKNDPANQAQIQATRDALDDVGLIGTFGLLGISLAGRHKRQRKEMAQREEIIKLMKENKR